MVFSDWSHKAVAYLFLLLIVVGCGSSTPDLVTTGSGSNPTVATSSVRLQSVLAQTDVPSAVVSFRATGYDRELNLRFGPVTLKKATVVEWSDVPVDVTDFVIEYLDTDGKVIGLAQVAVTLTAGEVFVIDNPTILTVSSTLESVTLTPTTVSVPAGLSTRFELFGHFSDGTTLDLTSAASWNSSSSAVATVEAGTAHTIAPGSSTITASFSGKSAQAQLRITEATLVSLSVSPNSPAIAGGTSQDFTVEGFYSDGSFEDVTLDAEWESSDDDVATMTAATATGVAAGQSTITATLDGKSASTVLTVTEATLESLEITGGASSIAKGTSTNFTATGHFSDDTTQDLTSEAQWNSSSLHATVSKGLVKGEAVGQGIAITASIRGRSDSVTVEITDAEVTSVRVETVVADASTLLTVEDSLELKAVAMFTDGSEQVVTDTANWESSATATATVSTGVGPRGVVAGVAPGQSDITATFMGKTGQLRVSVQVASPPALTLSSGNYTLNTDTGELSPQVGERTMAPGWNETNKQLFLESFTVETGATLNVSGSAAFKVRAIGNIVVAGAIDFSGDDGANGSNGQNGGDINISALGDLTVTGTITSNGGRGGDGASYSTGNSISGAVTAGSGGAGGNAGQITVTAGGTLNAHEARLIGYGGDGGDGGDVTSTGGASATVFTGRGGDGGAGRSHGGKGGDGGDLLLGQGPSSQVTAGAGGDGGEGGAHGGNGGNGGNATTGGRTTGAVTAGVGGDGGAGSSQGGNGGNGGRASIGGDSFSFVAAGAGGDGGEGGSQGGNGGNGGHLEIQGDNYSAQSKAGDGGDGGSPNSVGGYGGLATANLVSPSPGVDGTPAPPPRT